MYKLQAAAILGNVSKIQTLLQEEDGRSLVHRINSNGRTPLHECARGDAGPASAKVAELLLQHVEPELLANFVKKTDRENCTAVFYAVNNSNTHLLEVLLEAEASRPSSTDIDAKQEGKTNRQSLVQSAATHGPESLMYLATKYGSLTVLKLLLKYGYVIDSMEYGGLLKATVAKKNSPNHVEIFKFLIDLMIESEIMDEVQETDMDVKHILHYAARQCNLEILQAIATHPTLADEYFPFLRRRNQFTPLHYAIKSWHEEKFSDCARLLMDKCCNSDYEAIILYEELFNGHDSPLNFAFGEMKLHSAPYYVVEALLDNLPNKSPACWAKVRSNESIMTRLYTWAPQIIPKLINQSMKLVNVESVQLDLGCIIPVNASGEQNFLDKVAAEDSVGLSETSQPETRYLRKILSKEPFLQKAILLHPVVKIYLELKYKSFYAFNLFCCLIQVVFLSCYTYLIPAKYSIENNENNSSSTVVATNYKSSDIETETKEVNIDTETIDPQTYLFFLLATIILAVYVLPNGLKEVWQLMRYRQHYFTSLINWVQLINLCFVALICMECYQNVTVLYPVAAISGLLSWVLFLRELSKIFTECNIWSSALLKVVTRSIKLAIYFLPLLIGFYLMFQVLIPWRNFHYWLSGVGHMLILMTGEFEYDETFNNNSRTPEWQLFLATSSFLLFVMVIVISLSNLLVAVAVEDIQKLRRDSEFKSLASRLENMYNLEMVYLTMSKFHCIKWLLDCSNFFYIKITSFMILVSGCFCGTTGSDEEHPNRRNVSTMLLEISEDGMLTVPKNSFSAAELIYMGLN